MLGGDEVLERATWDTFWVPDFVRIVDRPELLCLACPEVEASLYNMVLRLRPPRGRLRALLDEVVEAHRGRESRVPVPPTIRSSELEEALLERSYQPRVHHHGYVLGTGGHRPRPRGGIRVVRVTTPAQLRRAVKVVGAAFGDPRVPGDDELERLWADCSPADARVQRYLAVDAETGEGLAHGGLTVHTSLGFGFLWGGGTVPGARGRGAYRAVLDARILRASQLGLGRVGLYGRDETSGPIVEALGFAREGPMVHWVRGPT